MPASVGDCPWARERIETHVDGELSGPELEAFERHVESCEMCREELYLARAVVSKLQALPPQSCPDRVVGDAAARIDADTVGDAGTWYDRLRERFGRGFIPIPRPVVAAVMVAIVAAVVVMLLQHERLPLTGNGEPPSEVAVTDEELESARQDVVLAFAYVEKYTLRSVDAVKHEGITNRVIDTVGRRIVEPMFPFPLDE